MFKNITEYICGNGDKSYNILNFDDDLVENNEWVMIKKPGEQSNEVPCKNNILIPDEYLQDVYDADDEKVKEDDYQEMKDIFFIDQKKSKILINIQDDDGDDDDDDDDENNMNIAHKHFSSTLLTSTRRFKTKLSKSNEQICSTSKLNGSFSDDQQQHSDFEPYRGPFWNLLDDTPLGRNGKALSNASSQPEIANIPSLEECWILSPAPCFTGEPRKCHKGSMEDLLIERTTKSVYDRYRIKISSTKSCDDNDVFDTNENAQFDKICAKENKSECNDAFEDDDDNVSDKDEKICTMFDKSKVSMFLSYFNKDHVYDSTEDKEMDDDDDDDDKVNDQNDDNSRDSNNIAENIIEVGDIEKTENDVTEKVKTCINEEDGNYMDVKECSDQNNDVDDEDYDDAYYDDEDDDEFGDMWSFKHRC